MDTIWLALAREARLAAEHIGIGATALSRANYAQDAYFSQAFFALSTGIERTAKLALVVDGALDNNGVFPESRTLRSYGHDLGGLLSALESIVAKHDFSGPYSRLPHSEVHDGIIETLNDFARNITRYYNLELVTGDPRAASRDDPIASWYRRVTERVLALHYDARTRTLHEARARQFEGLIGGFTSVAHHSGTGEYIDSVLEASKLTAATDFAKPWERIYVLQIARFIAFVLNSLEWIARRGQSIDVPWFGEIYAIFLNDDSFFKSRKTWSIYQS